MAGRYIGALGLEYQDQPITIEQLRAALQAKPFRRFDICLADGQRIAVPHQDFLWMPREASRTFVVYYKPEAYQIIDLSLVTALDFHYRGEPGHNVSMGRAGAARMGSRVDPVVQEVRNNGARFAAECGDDVHAMAEQLRIAQRSTQRTIIRRRPRNERASSVPDEK